MTPVAKHTTSRRDIAAATALLVSVVAVPAAQASARPDAGGPTTVGRPGPATTTTHDLAPADKVRGVGALSRVDAAEAREHARGRAVEVVSATGAVDLPELAVVGVTWDVGSAPGGTVQYRTEQAGSWSEWRFVEAEGDHAPDPAEAKEAAARTGGAREGSAPLITTDAEEIQVRIIAEADSSPVDAELMVVEPGSSTTSTNSTTSTTSSATATTTRTSTTTAATTTAAMTMAAPTEAVTAVAKPTIYTRAQWGADESVRDPSEPDYGVVDAAVVHHTAGSNTYTSDQVPGIIQGIYEYHVNGHGWRDIGYNFLVDRFGRTWEGRYGGMDKAVVGAHAAGVNSVMFGASVLGDFETAQPPSAVTTALRNLIAWKADLHRFDVLGTTVVDGTTYNNISGHRNVNATDCPGQYLYAKLPALRTATAALAPSATRIGGADRYEVAAATSASTFATGAPIAYIATGGTFPDALAAGPVGGHRGGPVLLTRSDLLVTPTITELKRLKPGRIVILGGTGSVSSAVEQQLRSYAPSVSRIGGADRYAVAAATSASTFAAGAPIAYIATGTTFPDALAAGPVGGHRGGPVLLTKTDQLVTPTITELKRLKPERIVILGGTGSVSSAVEQQLRSYSSTVSRIGGADRYNVAAATSASTFAAGAPIAYIATGTTFPDALAAGPVGGHRGGPVLLTKTDQLLTPTINELKRLKPRKIVILGGPASVSDAVARRLSSYEEPATS